MNAFFSASRLSQCYGRSTKRLGIKLIPLCLLMLILMSGSISQQSYSKYYPPETPKISAAVDYEITPYHPTIQWGGRFVAVTVHPTNTAIAIAASESGGLFKTTDSGATWSHLAGLEPFRMHEVRYAPGNGNVVIATVWGDNRSGLGNIYRSADGGDTWSRFGTCPITLSSWGIAFVPGSNRVYVGTDCGLETSEDLGATWTLNTLGATGLRRVIGVAAGTNGELYLCANNANFLYSASGQAGFQESNDKRCFSPHAVAVSPLDPTMFFVATRPSPNPAWCPRGFPSELYQGKLENRYGIAFISWTRIHNRCRSFARPAWVVVSRSQNERAGFLDIYFGDGWITSHKTCAPSQFGSRCNAETRWQEINPSHVDHNGLALDPITNCPRYLVSDGGVDQASNNKNAGVCNTLWSPSPSQGGQGLNALQIYQVTGQMVAPDKNIDMYIGTQDNSLWSSSDKGLSWPFGADAEGFYLQLPRYGRFEPPFIDVNKYVTYYSAGGNLDRNRRSERNLQDIVDWINPPGEVVDNPTHISPGVYLQWARMAAPPLDYRLYVTRDSSANWTSTGITITHQLLPWMQVSFTGNDVLIYQPIRGAPPNPNPLALQNLEIIRITGLKKDGTFTNMRVSGPLVGYTGSFGLGEATFVYPIVFGVNPWNPNRLLTADVSQSMIISSTVVAPNIVVSKPDVSLTNLLKGYDPGTGTNEFDFFRSDTSYPGGEPAPGATLQPHMIAFDPDHRGRILVGSENAGLIISNNGGRSWNVIPNSRQVTSATSAFFIPRGWLDGTNDFIIVSSYGRGLWKVAIPLLDRLPFDLDSETLSDWIDFGWAHEPDGDNLAPDYLQDPGFCPLCQYILARGGGLRDILADQEGNVYKLLYSTGYLMASSSDGLEIHLPVEIDISSSDGDFAICDVCQDIISQGGVVKGVILDEGQLVGVIGGAGDLPGEDQLWDNLVVDIPDLPEYTPPTGPYILLHTENYLGGPIARAGESVTIRGRNFCDGRNCWPVEIKIGNEILANFIFPDPDGTFSFDFLLNLQTGRYPISATQWRPGGSLTDTAWLAVVPGETELEIIPWNLFLPFIVR